MAAIRIKRRKEEDRRGFAPLYIEFYLNREKIRVPTGMKAGAKEFDAEKGCFRGKSKAAADNNLILQNLISKCSNILVKARLREEQLTKGQFFERFRRPSENSDFTAFVDYYYREERKRLEWNTLKTHKTVIRKLQKFKERIAFSDLTVEFLSNFVSWLRAGGIAETTLWKQVDILKVFVMAADRAGYLQTNPFATFRTHKPSSHRVFLDTNELSLLVKLFHSKTLSEPRQNVLRFFLFMCFTSLHVADARALRIEDVYAGHIHYERQKTHAVVHVPLNESARRLYEYYRNKRIRGRLVSNLPCDQKINKLLKKICQQAGIDKNVSCKAARHTYATIWADKTNDVVSLQSILGHTSITTTMIYTHVVEAKRLAGSKIFDAFL